MSGYRLPPGVPSKWGCNAGMGQEVGLFTKSPTRQQNTQQTVQPQLSVPFIKDRLTVDC